MPPSLVATQVVRVVRRELALLRDDPRSGAQLFQVADQLLQRAAIDDDLPRRRTAQPTPSDTDALISREIGEVDTAGPADIGDDPTTSFASAQPPSVTHRDLLAAFERHAPWMRPSSVGDVRRLSGGFSKELIHAQVRDASAGATDVVIRKVAPGRRADGLRPEYDIVSFVSGSEVPAPRPLWFDEDGLGSPAFATTALPGRIMGNVWGWTEPPSHAVVQDLGRAMGALHSLDPTVLATAPLPPLRARADHLAAIAERAHVLDRIWREGADPFRPVFEQVLDWLRANAPEDGAAQVLVHGDFGLHNALVANDRLTGMLDWERAHLGNPAEDLAYIKPSIDQAGAWSAFVAAYQQAGGPPVNSGDLTYFMVWQDLWRAVSSYRLRAKFLADPALLSDAVAGLLMSPRFLARAALGVDRPIPNAERTDAAC